MTEIFENIRKLYRFHVPDNELAEYIEFFSESSPAETHRQVGNSGFTIRMFPSWTPTMYLNLGEPYQLSLGPAHHLIDRRTDVLILRNGIVERHNLPTDHIFTVKFYPGGLEALLGVKQAGLIDQVVNLATILPTGLIQRVKQLAGFDERLHLLQHFFLNKLPGRPQDDHYRRLIASTIGTFEAGGMVLQPAQLADRAFVTSKTINRYFHRVVGTSPKRYLATVRARAALSRYVAAKSQFAPEEHGYYDMSHFYKEVIRFTGQRLGAQLR
jgi:AraC-like DNA-binding protein